MSGKLEGTYPRRLIKRTHNRNPTFHSFNLYGLLQPDQNVDAPLTQQREIKQTVKPSYSFNTIIGADVSPQKKSFIQSYVPQYHKPYLAERAQKSLIRADTIENRIFGARSKSTCTIDADSLHVAEDEFNKKKMRNPQYFISGSSYMSDQKAKSRVVLDLSPNSKRQLSIKRCQSIVDKQSKGYNIISNIGHN